MYNNQKIRTSILGTEAKKIEQILTSQTETIIFLEKNGGIDYEELELLSFESLEKLIESSIPGSTLRQKSAHTYIFKYIKENKIEPNSTTANSAFYKVEKMVKDDISIKSYIKNLRYEYFNLI